MHNDSYIRVHLLNGGTIGCPLHRLRLKGLRGIESVNIFPHSDDYIEEERYRSKLKQEAAKNEPVPHFAQKSIT